MDIWKVALVTLIWTFAVSLTYIIANTMLFDIIIPAMDETAYSARNNETGSGGFVDYDTYVARRDMMTSAFNVTCFIILLIPWAYIFVRVLFKKEQIAPAVYPAYQPAGSW